MEEMSSNFIYDIIDEDIANGFTEKIHTRFPPEPNGYLHIGSAKAIWINWSTAKKYGGLFNLRYDDTNPSKEDNEYVKSIYEDLLWLGAVPTGGVYYGSDYFDKCYEYAVKLIKDGKAYVCDLSAEEMKEYRGTLTEPGRESPYRNRSVEENLDLFYRMRDGEFEDGARTLRAKIDMASPNINMRDPAIYRIKHVAHHHTGTKWCIYPMYDFAHPIQDAIEGVTHSLCSLEYEAHRPLYNWVIEQCEFEHKPRQIEFARLNLTNTIMSKRYLRRLVEEHYVSGWDDPRMPTVCGMRRRGFPPAAIRAFCERVGVTKIESESDPALLEWCVREELNKTAARRMAVLDPVKLVIENFTGTRTVTKPNNPLDAAAGTREIPFSRELWIDRADFQENPEKKFFRLAPGREVRLAGACIVTCTGFEKDADGKITLIRCTWDEGSWGGNPSDGRKVKGTIHWVDCATGVKAEVRLYDYLIETDEEGNVPKDFIAALNKDSLETIDNALIEPSVKLTAAGTHYQFLRVGYFVVDPDTTPDHLVFNRVVGLRDSWAKVNK